MIEVTIQWDSGTEIYSHISIQYETYQTLPYLISISDISRAVLLDYSIENPTVEIILDNSTKHFSDRVLSELGLGSKIEVRDNGEITFTGWVYDFPDTGKKNIFKIKGDLFSKLDSPISIPISQDNFPGVDPDNEGFNANIIYGTANTKAEMFKAIKVPGGKYLASYTELSVLSYVHTPDGTDITSQISLDVDVNGYTYIVYDSTETYLLFSCLGPESGGDLIDNPAYMFSNLVSTFSNFETIDIEDAATVFTEREYQGDMIYIDDDITWLSFFSLFSQSFNCRIIITKEAKIKIKLIRWGMETPVLKIHPSLIYNFTYSLSREYIRGLFIRRYKYIPVDKEYTRNPADISGNINFSTVGELNLKFTNNDITAFDVASREGFFRSRKIIINEFSIPRIEANIFELGDTALVKSRNNIFDEYRQVQIIRENRTPGTGFVRFQSYDMTDYNSGIFIVCESESDNEIAILTDSEEDSPILL